MNHESTETEPLEYGRAYGMGEFGRIPDNAFVLIMSCGDKYHERFRFMAFEDRDDIEGYLQNRALPSETPVAHFKVSQSVGVPVAAERIVRYTIFPNEGAG